MVEYILAQHLSLNSGRSCFSLNLKRPVSYGSSSLSSLLICLEVAYMKQQKVAYRSMHIFLLLIKIKGHFVLSSDLFFPPPPERLVVTGVFSVK